MTYAASASQPTRAHVRDRNGRAVAAGVITAGASLEPVLSSVDRLERSVRQISGRAIENHAAGRHADDAIGKAFRELDVVHIDDDRNVSIAGDVGEQLHDFDRGLRVERGGWLVGEQHRGLLHHRARDADALALATGERVGAAPREAREADDAKQLEGTRNVLRRKLAPPRSPRRHVTQTARQDVFHHRQALDQVVLLEHHADAPSRPAQRPAREPDQILAVSFSYEALSKLPPEPLATSRTTAQVVL